MIYIDNMDMPKNCKECRMFVEDDGLRLCVAASDDGEHVCDDSIIQKWCPLKELIPCLECTTHYKGIAYPCNMENNPTSDDYFCIDGEWRFK